MDGCCDLRTQSGCAIGSAGGKLYGVMDKESSEEYGLLQNGIFFGQPMKSMINEINLSEILWHG